MQKDKDKAQQQTDVWWQSTSHACPMQDQYPTLNLWTCKPVLILLFISTDVWKQACYLWINGFRRSLLILTLPHILDTSSWTCKKTWMRHSKRQMFVLSSTPYACPMQDQYLISNLWTCMPLITQLFISSEVWSQSCNLWINGFRRSLLILTLPVTYGSMYSVDPYKFASLCYSRPLLFHADHCAI